jgi:hypothetical protein
MESGALRGVCKVLAGLSMAAGVVGMAMSFLYLASASIADITAGTSGFVAAAILIGSGLISLSVLACAESRKSGNPILPPESLLAPRGEQEHRISR